MTRLARLGLACSLALAGFAGTALAQEPAADLVARAKAEGRVVYYTDLIVDQIVRPMVAAFEKKYGVKVDFARADSQSTVIKLLGEHRAGNMQADVFGVTSGLQALIDVGAVRSFSKDLTSAIPPQFRDPEGYWISTNYYVMTPAVNTNLVPAAGRPKTFDDLLAPRWKDKMVWKPNDTSGAPGFIGNVLQTMGDAKGMDYLRKLAGQNVRSIPGSARAVLDQVIAGEYPLVLQIFNHHAALSAAKGAPVQWLAMEPAMVQMTQVAMPKASPHPAAGRLFVEFMLSEEGQTLFRKANYFPTRQDVAPARPELAPSTGHFKANFMSPAVIGREYEKWAKIYNELFR